MYRPQFQSCIESCQACAQACEACVAAVLEDVDAQVAGKYRRLAIDCAQLCDALAALLARRSDMVGSAGVLGKAMCTQCADEFNKLHAEEWQACAEACNRCAAECQRMLASLRHGDAEQPTGGSYAA